MDDAHEDRFQQHATLIARLAVILDAQDITTQDEEDLNERLTTAIERMEMSQSRLETVLVRMIGPAPHRTAA